MSEHITHGLDPEANRNLFLYQCNDYRPNALKNLLTINMAWKNKKNS